MIATRSGSNVNVTCGRPIALALLALRSLSFAYNTKFRARSGRTDFHRVLAVIVWFLLVPPWVGLGSFDAKAPLSRWYEAAEFVSLKECVQYRTDRIAVLEKEAARRNSKASAEAAGTERLYEQAKCVSDKDPRVD